MHRMNLVCALTVILALAGCSPPGGAPSGTEATASSLVGCAHVPPSAPVDLFIQKRAGTCFGLHLEWRQPVSVATGRTCGPIRSYEIFVSSDQAIDRCVQDPNPQFDTRSVGVVSGSQTSFDTSAFDPGNQWFTVRATTDAGTGPVAPWQGAVCTFCTF